MTIHEWLTDSIAALTASAIETARLDALVLLSDQLQRDKSWVLGHPEYILQRSVIKNLSKKIAQRIQHMPLAYIRGSAEFFGRDFIVNERVLVPRPESEGIIELLKRNTPKGYEGTIIDIGTGSGALGITAALEFPNAQICATDIDSSALAVAKQNATRHHAKVRFLRGNLLDACQNELSVLENAILLTNLPYVPEGYPLNQAATHEPRLAIFGGHDGLNLYKNLCTQISLLRAKPSVIITESLCMQHEKIIQLMNAVGYAPKAKDGLAQYFVYK